MTRVKRVPWIFPLIFPFIVGDAWTTLVWVCTVRKHMKRDIRRVTPWSQSWRSTWHYIRTHGS